MYTTAHSHHPHSEIGSRCFFTQGYVLLNNTENVCQAEFGITNYTVAKNVANTNIYYGGRNPASTCVLYPSGEVDPWNSQSILKSQSPGVQTIWVPGASHHFWTHPTLPTDQASVVTARKVIRQFVLAALSQDCGQL